MAWTQTDIDDLDRAYRSGAQKVRFPDGRELTYRTVAEYQSLRATMLAEVSPSAVAGPSYAYASFRRD